MGVFISTARLRHCRGLCRNKFWTVPMLSSEVRVQVEQHKDMKIYMELNLKYDHLFGGFANCGALCRHIDRDRRNPGLLTIVYCTTFHLPISTGPSDCKR